MQWEEIKERYVKHTKPGYDLVMCYKFDNLTFSDFFAFSPSTVTREH